MGKPVAGRTTPAKLQQRVHDLEQFVMVMAEAVDKVFFHAYCDVRTDWKDPYNEWKAFRASHPSPLFRTLR